MTIDLDNWQLAHVWGYWDARTDAIGRFSKSLRSIADKNDKEQVLKKISQAIEKHVDALDNELLLSAAISAVDHLYKCGDSTKWFDDTTCEYISASCGTLLQLTAKRGFYIHYLVDLAYSMPEFGTFRPIDVFPRWFQSAEIVFVCPQAVASALMENDGLDRAKYMEALPQYIAEARDVTTKLVERCHTENRHYVYLDAASVKGTFDKSTSLEGSAGIVTVLRDTPATFDSTVAVRLPNKR